MKTLTISYISKIIFSKNIAKLLLFLTTIVCFVPVNAQTLTKTARYKGMEIKLPEAWTFETQEVERGVMYQMVCMGKNNTGDANTIALAKADMEIDLEGFLNVMKGAFQVAIPGNPFFSQNRIGTFRNYRTLYCTFSGNIGSYRYSGQIMVFHDKGRTFLILHQGDARYYESGLNDRIFATFKL